MKHLFYDLWASIRKSPFLFLFLFIQIVITSLVLYTVLANYYWTDEQSGNAQIAWGDREYLKLFTKANAPMDKSFLLVFSKNFYVLHPFFVFNVLACTIYFELGFAFSLMACSVALWKNNSVVILGVPFLFYHLENFVSSQLGGFLPLWSADSVLAFNTEHNILELSVPLIVIMIISVLLIEIKIHSRKGWVIQ